MFSVMNTLDLFGVAIFAITGALIAEQQQINILGILVSATVTAVGGGTLRDMMLGATPVFWIQNPVYLIVALLGGLSIFIVSLHHKFKTRIFLLADTLSLAIFTIIGIQKAIAIDIPLFSAILLGTLTGVGGGVIRDVFLGRRLPLLFQQELYATAAFLGGSLYVILTLSPINNILAVCSSIALVLYIRLTALHWGIKLPIFQIREPNRPTIDLKKRQLQVK